MKYGYLIGWGLALSVLVGCGAVQLDAQTEGDGVRDQAMGVFVGRTVTDRVDGDTGDNTDWRYIDTVDPGRLELEITFDNPERLAEAEIEFLDEFGTRIDRFLISGSKSNYVFAREVQQTPAKFYIRVFAQMGSSVYSIGARQSIAASAKPEPVETKQTVKVVKVTVEKKKKKKRKRTKRRRPKKTTKKTTKKTVKVTKTVVKKETKPVTTNAAPIKGTVIRIIPADDNNSVTLTVNLKGGARVPKGATGTVYKGGTALGKMRVASVSGKRVTGVLRVRSGKAKGLLKVVFPPN